MKTTINKEFFEKWKDKDVVMWCKKKEYAEEFCRLMDENGLETYDGSSFLFKNTWELFEDLTVYEFNSGNYSNKESCLEDNYTILDFEDYIIEESVISKVYVLTEYYNNGAVWEDIRERETIVKVFKDLNDALKYRGRNFKKNVNAELYSDGYLYISEDEDLEEEHYLNYRIYEVEVR